MNLKLNFFLILFAPLFIVSCKKDKQPNVVILLADQWRAQATGYAGDPNVKTPAIDKLASESFNFSNAVSGMPVCCPYRASFMTGQRPLTHGVFMNDVQLDTNAVSLGKVFAKAGYKTGYIGKWHLNANGRSNFIQPGNRRQGFQYWKANECSHSYNNSIYYENNDPKKKHWQGYDTFAQTDDAIKFIKDHSSKEEPFLLFLSWGTPHAPYNTAPDEYRKMYNAEDMILRPNVPDKLKEKVRKDLAGYYAHASALDDMVGKIRKAIGKDDNTIILFTADHGDLLGSQGAYKKQQPYEESVRIPMLYHIPNKLKKKGVNSDAMMNTEDIMPTLLGLCGISIPKAVEGIDYSGYIKGVEENPGDTATIITCVQPFGQWNVVKHNGREYRGLKTLRYTYTRDINGPWLLFDNKKDPYQLNNLVDKTEFSTIKNSLDALLTKKLIDTNDQFLTGIEYVNQWGYTLNETGTVPYER